MTDEQAVIVDWARCPLCRSQKVVRLPDPWPTGGALRRVGCGNPWHYAILALDDTYRTRLGRLGVHRWLCLTHGNPTETYDRDGQVLQPTCVKCSQPMQEFVLVSEVDRDD